MTKSVFILEERRLRGDGSKVGMDLFSKVTNYKSRSHPRVQEEREEKNFVSVQGDITLCCKKTHSKMTWPRKPLTSPPKPAAQRVPMSLSVTALEGLVKDLLGPESPRGLLWLGLPRVRMPRTC